MATRSKSKATDTIWVRVVRSFNTLYQGEVFETENDDKTQGYIRGGFLIETKAPDDGSTDGTRAAGPGIADTDLQRGEPAGTVDG
jgi:hypothetical protein